MIIRINGQETIQAKRIEVIEEAPAVVAWGAVLAAVVTAGWWWLQWA